jgi:hypothetical protein
MERVRKSFIEKGNDNRKLKMCCLKVEDIFELPNPDVEEIKDIENNFNSYQALPDPLHYVFVVIDLRDNTVELVSELKYAMIYNLDLKAWTGG